MIYAHIAASTGHAHGVRTDSQNLPMILHKTVYTADSKQAFFDQYQPLYSAGDLRDVTLFSTTNHVHIRDPKAPIYQAIYKGSNAPGTEKNDLVNYRLKPLGFEKQVWQEALGNIWAEVLLLKLQNNQLERESIRQSDIWRASQVAAAKLPEGPDKVAELARMKTAAALLKQIESELEEIFPVHSRARLIKAQIDGAHIIGELPYHPDFRHPTDPAFVPVTFHDIACDNADVLVEAIMARPGPTVDKGKIVDYIVRRMVDDKLLEQSAYNALGLRDSTIDSKRYWRRGYKAVKEFSAATTGRAADAYVDTTLREYLVGRMVAAAATALFVEGPPPS